MSSRTKSPPLRAACHASRPARWRVLWADGRGYWLACSKKCIELWKRELRLSARRWGKNPDPEIVSIKPIGGRA
jgi:hypothetical protein